MSTRCAFVLAAILALLVPRLAHGQAESVAGSGGMPKAVADESVEVPTGGTKAGDEEADDEEAGDEKSEAEEAGDDKADMSPDAHRDPVLSKLIKRRRLIDRPKFSLETRGKLQVQYYDADSGDPDGQDELFLRRFRPYLLGHVGKNWDWKLEAELGADVEARSIDLEQLDIRDLYLRYQKPGPHGWRLTLGNQKAPFSRDFLTSSTRLLLVERSFAGSTSAGVPDRALGVHLRGTARQGKLAFWASLGRVGHIPNAQLMKFDSPIGARSDLNRGNLIAARIDVHPRGPTTFFDSDLHTPVFKTTWSVAGYAWDNDGSTNRFTAGVTALDPAKADLDSATGLELSGGLRGRGFTFDWQLNRIRGETVAAGFSGGIYTGGATRLDVAAIEAGYRFRRSPVELGGALSRLEADGYSDPWRKATLALNLYLSGLIGKLQITHSWTSSRFGVPGDDVQETRVQAEYHW